MQPYDDHSPGVEAFLDDVDAALGAALVGAFLFGSHARGDATAESDVDLLLVIADASADESRTLIYQTFADSTLEAHTVSLNVETYLRVKRFLTVGDPFVWVICHGGRVLRERSHFLTTLQRQCVERDEQDMPDASAMSQYLMTKCVSEYDLAMQALQQTLSHFQLSVVAGAEAAATRARQGRLRAADMLDLAEWEHLERSLLDLGATEDEISCLKALVSGPKVASASSGAFPGSDIIENAQAAGALWTRLGLME